MPKAPKCANPMFLRWVKEMHDEKDYRKRGGPPRATGYENAIRSLQWTTTKYDHPLDMKGKVTGVGPTTIRRLTEKLEEYCARRGIPMPEVKPKPTRAKKAPAKSKAEPKGKPVTKSKAEKENDEDFAIDFEAEAVVIKPYVKATLKRKATNVREDDDDEEKLTVDSDIEIAPAKPKRKATRRVAKVVVTDDDDDDFDE
ncbi:hypothetical protein BJ912DRAFT_619022 [Pholiota molesta]|nr:hypothetical protein BJ912DRAFT_619022 [Pholiota molesta]